MAALIADTLALVQSGRISALILASIVGRWTDTMLLRRPLLSIWGAVYSRVTSPAMSPEVKKELVQAVRLAPFIERNVYKRFAPILLAYDASLHGGAVVYCRVSPEIAESFAKLEMRTMFDTDGSANREKQTTRLLQLGLDSMRWKISVQLPLGHWDAHIDSKE